MQGRTFDPSVPFSVPFGATVDRNPIDHRMPTIDKPGIFIDAPGPDVRIDND